jgi:ferric-dicitrate binding protein FerR (iron transport regulator)
MTAGKPASPRKRAPYCAVAAATPFPAQTYRAAPVRVAAVQAATDSVVCRVDAPPPLGRRLAVALATAALLAATVPTGWWLEYVALTAFVLGGHR